MSESVSDSGSAKSLGPMECDCAVLPDTIYCRVTFWEADPDLGYPHSRIGSAEYPMTSPCPELSQSQCDLCGGGKQWGGSYDRYVWDVYFEVQKVTFYTAFCCSGLSVGWTVMGQVANVGTIECPPFPAFFEFNSGSYGMPEIMVRLQWTPFE